MTRFSLHSCRSEDPFLRLADAAGPGVRLVVDGGANKGRTVQRLLGLFPGAVVAAYEPQPRLARKLAKRFANSPAVRVRMAGLGAAPGKLMLNVLESHTCSSFLAPEAIREKHAGKPMGVAQVVEVEVVRLDADLERAPEVIKLDLQGYELEALQGAEGMLGGVKAVLCEVSFRMMYAGQPLCREVANWMEARGFRLEGLYSPWADGEGKLAAADALFTRG
ncbi:MAG: FkbM family methyltransferase [Thermodesulfobacteriota bacterium]